MLEDRLRALGQQVRRIRRRKGLTQAELAEKANVSMNYVGQIERAVAQVTLQTLFMLADALEVNVSTLFTPLDRWDSREDLGLKIESLVERLVDF